MRCAHKLDNLLPARCFVVCGSTNYSIGVMRRRDCRKESLRFLRRIPVSFRVDAVAWRNARNIRLARYCNIFINPYNFYIMSKKTILSILVLILFAVVAVASSSSSKISDETIRDSARAGAGLIVDLSN